MVQGYTRVSIGEAILQLARFGLSRGRVRRLNHHILYQSKFICGAGASECFFMISDVSCECPRSLCGFPRPLRLILSKFYAGRCIVGAGDVGLDVFVGFVSLVA